MKTIAVKGYNLKMNCNQRSPLLTTDYPSTLASRYNSSCFGITLSDLVFLIVSSSVFCEMQWNIKCIENNFNNQDFR